MISHQLSGGCCYHSYICSCTVRLCSSNMVTLMLYCVHEVSSPASLRAQIRKLFREPCVNSNYTAQHPRSCLTLFLSLALLDIFTYCIICLHTLHQDSNFMRSELCFYSKLCPQHLKQCVHLSSSWSESW